MKRNQQVERDINQRIREYINENLLEMFNAINMGEPEKGLYPEQLLIVEVVRKMEIYSPKTTSNVIWNRICNVYYNIA